MSAAGGSRARNGMNRGQAAVIAAVGQVLTERGVAALTMTELARRAGVARATLYNHVRSRDDALRLYAESEALLMVTRLLTDDHSAGHATSDGPSAGGPPDGAEKKSALDQAAAAVVGAALAVREHPGLAAVRRDEPVLLMALLSPGTGATWDEVRSLVRVLVSGGQAVSPAGVDLVLGWILLQGLRVSGVTSDVARKDLTEQAQLLLDGVLGVPAAADPGQVGVRDGDSVVVLVGVAEPPVTVEVLADVVS